jgi:hypothetical protein
MTSILSRGPKQIPTDTQYFVSISPTTLNVLKVFNNDPQNPTTSYVSGAARGYFTSSNVTITGFDASGGINLFRDMGQKIVSSGRTFRAVQLLVTDGTPSTGAGGGSGWTSSNAGTPGVWKASNEGVQGSPTGASVGGDFGVFYFETGARGLGIAQGLVRYG